MKSHEASSRQEWAASWPLVLTSTLGLSGCAMFAFSSGVFMEPMTSELGWSRAQFSSAFILQMLLGFLILPAVGWLSDRIGPRRIVVFGLVPFAIGFALLGTVDVPLTQWWLLCGLMALGQGFIAQTLWVAAVISRFEASRGMAMAVTLSGLGLGSFMWPPLTAFFIDWMGWRLAFAGLAITYCVIELPLAIAFFRDNDQVRINSATREVISSYGSVLKSGTFLGLMAAGGLFSCAYYGTSVHLVPILRGGGIPFSTAPVLAGLVGLFSITGRLLAGYLLDRLPTRTIGIVAFLLPVGTALLLLSTSQTYAVALGAVALLGLAAGAEMDIVTYIAAKRYGQQVFGAIYSIFVSVLAAFASLGPLLGGVLFDANDSYEPFLLAVIGMVATGAMLIAIIPSGPPTPRSHPN